MKLSIVIPAYNEEQGIVSVLRELVAERDRLHADWEIILVNDGSKDRTAQLARSVQGVTVISHPYNKGYGAALKTGIRAASGEWCMTYDADHQHTPNLVTALLPHCTPENDMVVGKREGYQGPWIRQPGKRLIAAVANYLTQQKIPDLNSGLRAFKRSQFLRFLHLFPNGFSLSTTSTVCFFKEHLNVIYVPITIQARVGKSTVKMRDAVKTVMLIVRLIMLFSPLRIFLPAAVISGILATALLIYELVMFQNVSDSAVALLSLTAILFFFGLLADQIAAIRRELHH
ncbi:glycosyltransferase family 2 protein [Candidatus Peregrinibacteria bacterium]|nr:glycosyltransferase family 2 protein [Candidatus Peregrinibacteria bacterium]